MARILFSSTNGSESPTKAAVPFLSARGAIEAGHEPEIVLIGDAVVMVKDVVAKATVPVGWPPVGELFDFAVENKVPIHV